MQQAMDQLVAQLRQELEEERSKHPDHSAAVLACFALPSSALRALLRER